jgi:branched-chain amino acid transport system ATP-binding protein
MIAGVLTPRQGAIRFDGETLTASPSHVVVRHGITLVPEGHLAFPQMTVLENLRLGAHTRTAARLPELLDRAFALFPRLRRGRERSGPVGSNGHKSYWRITPTRRPTRSVRQSA